MYEIIKVLDKEVIKQTFENSDVIKFIPIEKSNVDYLEYVEFLENIDNYEKVVE